MILTPGFKLVFTSVLCLTVLSFLMGISLSLAIEKPSSNINGWIETCSTTFKLGFGAIVGLIGGKAL